MGRVMQEKEAEHKQFNPKLKGRWKQRTRTEDLYIFLNNELCKTDLLETEFIWSPGQGSLLALNKYLVAW